MLPAVKNQLHQVELCSVVFSIVAFHLGCASEASRRRRDGAPNFPCCFIVKVTKIIDIVVTVT